MSKLDAEYFGHRRRAQGASVSALFSVAKSLQRAIEPRRLEQVPWPRNLFDEPASIAELVAEAVQLSDQAGENPNDTCRCGCRRGHKHNVSQTLRSPYGRGFDVIYFWSNGCKSKWNRERMRSQASGF
jgi:hypothetical protein